MQPTKHPRELSHDEKRAADLAFKGLPFDSRWSPSARAIYDGIRGALGAPALPQMESVPASGPTTAHSESPTAPAPPSPAPTSDDTAPILTREQAIQAGFLIDVTPTAHRLGLPAPVSFSKPLWLLGITASDQIPEDQREARVRDVLMALRLRLANTRVVSPGIEFAALLSFPPKPTPQLLSLYAITHGDPSTPHTLTILLANEVTAIIRPTNN